jgi:hypothetical protein
MKHTFDLNDLKRRLKNARNRALYWSGNPSFTGKRYNPSNSRSDDSLQYELAMCDIKSLTSLIEDITGKRPKQSDPKDAFRKRYHALMMSLPPAGSKNQDKKS